MQQNTPEKGLSSGLKSIVRKLQFCHELSLCSMILKGFQTSNFGGFLWFWGSQQGGGQRGSVFSRICRGTNPGPSKRLSKTGQLFVKS